MSQFSRVLALTLIATFMLFTASACSKTDVAKEAEVVKLSETESLSANAFESVKVTLCDKQVVLLGEGPNHGEGTTIAFKAQLAQSLIEDCGFSLLLFESSLYQSIKLNRDVSEGHHVNLGDIEAVISFVWRDDVEMEPLINFIHGAVNKRSLKLGGIDDQIGSRGQDYANFVMPIEITELLNEPRREECRAALKQRIIYSFSKDDPYSHAKKQFLLACLKTLRADESSLAQYDSEAAMIESLYRDIRRDFINNKSQLFGREESMFKNFEYWYDGAKNSPRTIIWTATVHAAKSGKVLQLPEGAPHLGELINTRFGNSAYVLGFSSLEGSHALMGRGIEDLPVAPENSIEAITFRATNDDIAFLPTTDLEQFGMASSAAMNNSYQVREWAHFLDGMVIFQEQNPSTKAFK